MSEREKIIEVIARVQCADSCLDDCGVCGFWKGETPFANRALSALEAAGYVIVPKEPSLAMQNKFEAAYFREHAAGPDECFADSDPFSEAYAAMIAAAGG